MKVVMMKSTLALLCAGAFFSCKKDAQEPLKLMDAKLVNAKMTTEDGFEQGPKFFKTSKELETAFDMLAKEFAKSVSFTDFTEKVALDAADALTKKINGAGYATRKIFIKSEKPFYPYVKILGADRSNEDKLKPGYQHVTLKSYCAAVVFVDEGGEILPIVIDPLLADEPRSVREWGTLLTQDHNWEENPEIRHTYNESSIYNIDWDKELK